MEGRPTFNDEAAKWLAAKGVEETFDSVDEATPSGDSVDLDADARADREEFVSMTNDSDSHYSAKA